MANLWNDLLVKRRLCCGSYRFLYPFNKDQFHSPVHIMLLPLLIVAIFSLNLFSLPTKPAFDFSYWLQTPCLFPTKPEPGSPLLALYPSSSFLYQNTQVSCSYFFIQVISYYPANDSQSMSQTPGLFNLNNSNFVMHLCVPFPGFLRWNFPLVYA